MIVMIVEVTVKAGMEREFLELITDDALTSEAEEPGCLRFDVLQDADDPAKYYFYEVYRDEATHAAHMEMPHLKRIDARIPDLFEGAVVHRTRSIVPGDAAFAR